MNLKKLISIFILFGSIGIHIASHAQSHSPFETLKQKPKTPLNYDESWSIDFNDHKTGNYSLKELNIDWFSPKWVMGRNLLSVVNGKEAYSGKSLKLRYPAGKSSCKNAKDCIQWHTDLDVKLDTLYYGFRIKFSENFDFVWGGKLPGLAGGNGNSGGNIPNGKDGWSVRIMWNDENQLVSYVYHPDQVWKYGDTYIWDMSEQKNGEIERGKWHTIQTRLQLNTPGKKDGSIIAWLNGKRVLVKKGLRFRDINSLEIDNFHFVSFFGGNGPKWAPKVDQTAYIDDVRISRIPPFFIN